MCIEKLFVFILFACFFIIIYIGFKLLIIFEKETKRVAEAGVALKLNSYFSIYIFYKLKNFTFFHFHIFAKQTN